ncbi:MAG: type II toxin-antitoxin system VapC family toxin [Pirellulales bacterium]
MQYLVDTGVLLRLFDRSDAEHATIRKAFGVLRAAGHSLATCPQNIAEFWNVSTRPTSARGGYGQSIPTTERRVKFIENVGTLLSESPAVYQKWRELLIRFNVVGLAVYDARLVAMMEIAGISHIVTLNGADFARYPSITSVTPAGIATSTSSQAP